MFECNMIRVLMGAQFFGRFWSLEEGIHYCHWVSQVFEQIDS